MDMAISDLTAPSNNQHHIFKCTVCGSHFVINADENEVLSMMKEAGIEPDTCSKECAKASLDSCKEPSKKPADAKWCVWCDHGGALPLPSHGKCGDICGAGLRTRYEQFNGCDIEEWGHFSPPECNSWHMTSTLRDAS